jgi:hypothetical protein
MSIEQKVISPKLGLLELAEQPGVHAARRHNNMPLIARDEAAT